MGFDMNFYDAGGAPIPDSWVFFGAFRYTRSKGYFSGIYDVFDMVGWYGYHRHEVSEYQEKFRPALLLNGFYAFVEEVDAMIAKTGAHSFNATW